MMKLKDLAKVFEVTIETDSVVLFTFLHEKNINRKIENNNVEIMIFFFI